LSPATTVGGRIARGQQDHVSRPLFLRGAQARDDFGAVQARHHPVEQRDRRRVGHIQLLQGTLTIRALRHLVARFFQHRRHDGPGDQLVVGDQDVHRAILAK
jgi:hypothetical protein